MATIFSSPKGKKKKVVLQTYYNLDGNYILFDDNQLHGKTFENVAVVVFDRIVEICGIKVKEDVVYITDRNQEPIECEYLGHAEDGDTLIIKLCQDWG